MSPTTLPVVVVGDCNLDVLVGPNGPIRRGADVTAQIELAAGGQAANVAVRLARAGVVARLVAPLARDAAGSILREAIAADGVELVALPVDATGTVVVLRNDRGERSMLSRRAPFPPDAPDAVARALDGARWEVVSGYALLDPAGEAVSRRVAPPRAVPLAILGCAVGAAAARFLGLVQIAGPDLVILNRDEAVALGVVKPSWSLHDRAAVESIAPVPSATITVVTDLGGAAATLGAERVVEMAEESGAPAVDATGAGDAVAAGLLALLVTAAWPPTPEVLGHALRSGVALGSAVARVSGAQGRVAAELSGRLPA